METLFLYITAFEEVVGIVLIIERDGKQNLVYYTSKAFHNDEVRYQKIEKVAYVVI